MSLVGWHHERREDRTNQEEDVRAHVLKQKKYNQIMNFVTPVQLASSCLDGIFFKPVICPVVGQSPYLSSPTFPYHGNSHANAMGIATGAEADQKGAGRKT